MTTQPLRQSRLKLLSIFAIFFVPLTLAWVWYANVDRWQPKLGANYGELITPAVPLAEFTLSGTSSVDRDTLRHRWTMVIAVSAVCDDACQHNLYYSRQIRLALGRDSLRVQRLLLLPAGGSDLAAEWLQQEHPDLLVAEAGDLLPQLQAAAAQLPAVDQAIFLVDPLANVMMRFPAAMDPRLVIEDIKRLLKISQIG